MSDEAGKSLRDVTLLNQGDVLNIHMLNGQVKALVQEIHHMERAGGQQSGEKAQIEGSKEWSGENG